MQELKQDNSPGKAKSRLAQSCMQTLWPAFLGAVIGTGIIFSLFDPADARDLPTYFPQSVEGIYTVTFLLLWVANTVSCATTWYLSITTVKTSR